MSIWLTIPSARPTAEANIVLAKWRAMGYKIALLLDSEADAADRICDMYSVAETYPGYAQAVNGLVRTIIKSDPDAEWFVIGGDDTEPDASHSAESIAFQCGRYFGELRRAFRMEDVLDNEGVFRHKFARNYWSTFGVCQPTGDRFANGSIDRIAGSAWIGREWCLRANQGQGPLFPAFTHMFGDEALKRTAEKLGVYWMRRDLTHLHRHFMRETDLLDSRAVTKSAPPHLVKWNTQQHWEEMKTLFERLEAENFAPCMPLAEVAA